jgi:hypothetical protein
MDPFRAVQRTLLRLEPVRGAKVQEREGHPRDEQCISPGLLVVRREWKLERSFAMTH